MESQAIRNDIKNPAPMWDTAEYENILPNLHKVKRFRGDGRSLSQILAEPETKDRFLVDSILSRGDKGYLVAGYKAAILFTSLCG